MSTPLSQARILLVGCGKMGGALLEGWLRHGLSPANAVVVEPQLLSVPGIRQAASARDIPVDFTPTLAVFALKPQVLDAALPDYAHIMESGAAVVSIVAGKTVRSFAQVFGDTAPIIRVMPNTPALIGEGATVAFANPHVIPAQRALVSALFEAAGKCWWVEDEGVMDAVTALSGSGPAYVFHFIECLTQAGAEIGLPAELAEALAIQTLKGASLLAAQSDEAVEVLRKNVTSPGGTTEAALKVLMGERGLQPLVSNALLAAVQRARELAG